MLYYPLRMMRGRIVLGMVRKILNSLLKRLFYPCRGGVGSTVDPVGIIVKKLVYIVEVWVLSSGKYLLG